MILKIINAAQESIRNDSGDYEMKPELLKLKGTHVFIASKKWDEIRIELTEDIPLGSLKYIPKQAGSIHVSLPEAKTAHIMQLCTELFPERSGTIRKTFLSKGDIPSELLC